MTKELLMENRTINKFWIIIFLLSIFVTPQAFAGTEDESKSDHKLPIALQKCTSDEVGMTFDCDPSWKLNRYLKTLKVTISENPQVEFLIEESQQSTHFMSELTEDAFASTGRYEEGFHFEHQIRCNREAIKINGYLKGSPQIRVSDFFLIDHGRIHSVKFTVDPKDAWENYKWLIKDVIDSIKFFKQPHSKFNLEETDETCEDLVK